MRLPLVSSSCFCRAALLLSLLASLVLAAGTAAATKKPPSQPINLNAASSEQLQQVPGIGPATADKILQMRKSYGPFKSVDDLLAIRGIGKKRLDKMRKYLIAGRPAMASKPGAASKSPGAPGGASPASCKGCAKAAPPAKETSLPAKSFMKTVPTSEKPADTPAAPETDEEPQWMLASMVRVFGALDVG
jgi:competence ComEA-like helix-hairpin-helix protein